MEEVKRRERSKNFTIYEDDLLTKCLEPYRLIFISTKSDNVTNNAKHKAWNEVTKRFNSESTGEYRSFNSLKMRYKNGFKKRLYKDEVEPHDKDPDTSDTGDEDLDKPSKRPKPKPTDEDTNWLQYFNEIKAEEQEAHPNNLESDDDPFEQIPVKTGNYTQSPIQETAPQTNSTLLNDKLTMAKINLLQKQAILAEKQSDVCDREMKFVEEKTKFLQKKCHCDLAVLQHLN